MLRMTGDERRLLRLRRMRGKLAQRRRLPLQSVPSRTTDSLNPHHQQQRYSSDSDDAGPPVTCSEMTSMMTSSLEWRWCQTTASPLMTSRRPDVTSCSTANDSVPTYRSLSSVSCCCRRRFHVGCAWAYRRSRQFLQLYSLSQPIWLRIILQRSTTHEFKKSPETFQ